MNFSELHYNLLKTTVENLQGNKDVLIMLVYTLKLVRLSSQKLGSFRQKR